ncbi:uncharacterized protein PGTG_16646 [Puccinia graminis f. sp. tritici CRL 75-36-700-3]|uniref:CxC1-like cysteine cluster associated with KDZ transposases domain-containing protein n=1 Tax=Puccinia graminis f. sp. tritici (strain CRL 75-36-700-3 / race SCCL) TaxID=418459 RepID=E3L245_PUCGT|nr:uncharacterized protein PGTG_16646 [Puccinia graminis f. sp. tritici CRL 75-36-700-3]EFP90620.2 hypothetical protein PGTG_16646 [Puccinia graminis f. sp. tritici CRL 75-36-700-3]
MPPKSTQAKPSQLTRPRSQSTQPKLNLTRNSTRPRLDESKPKRTSRVNPYRHETPGQRALREKNEARLERSYQRIEALHRGELPMPSSSRALEAHLQSQQDSGQEEERQGIEGSNQLTSSHLWDNFAEEDSADWETLEETPRPVTSLSQRIFDFNSQHKIQALRRNWDRIIPQLHGVYMWLKFKTANWTASNSFDSFEGQFCNCTQFKYRTVDFVDLMSQKRIRQKFCNCLPDAVRLLTLGYIGSSPIRPRTAISVRLLQFHDLAWQWCHVATQPFTEVVARWVEVRSTKLWNENHTKRRDIRKCFSAAVDIFRLMLQKTTELVNTSLQLTKTQRLAKSCCPGCFGTSILNDSHIPQPSVKDSLIVCLDGNFQHRRHANAGVKGVQLVNPPIFLKPEAVENMRSEIENLGRPEVSDPCSDSHKAANDKRSESTWKGCDDTGLMGCCCRHDQVVYLANIHRTGEQRSLPVAILKQLLEEVDGRPLGRDFFAFPEKKELIKFGTSVFHAYVHEWKCQVAYNPRFNVGWGLSDGEGLERLWSSLSPLVRTLRYSSRNHRLAALSHQLLWLRKKFGAAQLARREAKEKLKRLLLLSNPFSNGGRTNYTKQFFISQWENQVNHLKQVSDEDTEQRNKLTKLIKMEKSLKKLRDMVAKGKWDNRAEILERSVEEIEQAEASQVELAAQLGFMYTGAGTDFEKEKMKLLVWSKKRELYTKAVEIMGVRQPISESRTRARNVGTTLKEKIYESINGRKGAVLRLINQFNKVNEAYLEKYDQEALNDPEYKALSWDLFASKKLDDIFWNEAHFYHSQAPWAVSLDVREGIRSFLMVDRAEEELDLIAQELGRAMTWAVELHNMLDQLAGQIKDLSPNTTEVVIPARVGTLSAQTGQQVLMFELYLQLADHVKLMRLWAPDVDWLWGKTRLPGSSHRWFELVSSLGTNLDASDMIVEDLEPTIDEIEEQLQEEVFIDDANDGELAGDEEVQEMVGDANPDQPND